MDHRFAFPALRKVDGSFGPATKVDALKVSRQSTEVDLGSSYLDQLGLIHWFIQSLFLFFGLGTPSGSGAVAPPSWPVNGGSSSRCEWRCGAANGAASGPVALRVVLWRCEWRREWRCPRLSTGALATSCSLAASHDRTCNLTASRLRSFSQLRGFSRPRWKSGSFAASHSFSRLRRKSGGFAASQLLAASGGPAGNLAASRLRSFSRLRSPTPLFPTGPAQAMRKYSARNTRMPPTRRLCFQA